VSEALRLNADVTTTATPRVGRHFYDVSLLLAADEVATFLADEPTVRSVPAQIEDISEEHFTRGAPDELRPKGGFRRSRAFDISSKVADRPGAAYESDMEDLYYTKEPLPTWEDICEQVASSSVRYSATP
jgi:hypothetical protein